MRDYQDRDPRIFYARYPTNRGGVAVNEIGMAMACEQTEFWSRLGSDDWFGPRKLELDADAFSRGAEAVWGPYYVSRGGRLQERCSPRLPEGQANHQLLSGGFCASWVNVAVRTSALRKVRDKFGNFCDPRLRNMEDFLVNARIASVAEWKWRGGVEGECEAVWNCLEGTSDPVSASANAAQTGRDGELTRALIAEMAR
jgi:hypothetical protein